MAQALLKLLKVLSKGNNLIQAYMLKVYEVGISKVHTPTLWEMVEKLANQFYTCIVSDHSFVPYAAHQ